jgi:hypothetical protein
MPVSAAIYDRWNDASLDDTIAKLYPGDDDAAPEEAELPRAQYTILDEEQISLSKGYRVTNTPVRIQIWYSTYNECSDKLDDVDENFTNSEQTATNPMSMPETDGAVMGVEKTTRTVIKENDRVYQGVIQFDFVWQKANAIPT